jgi:hypothetical protein
MLVGFFSLLIEYTAIKYTPVNLLIDEVAGPVQTIHHHASYEVEMNHKITSACFKVLEVSRTIV